MPLISFFWHLSLTVPYSQSDDESIIVLIGFRTHYHKIQLIGALTFLSWIHLRKKQKPESHPNFIPLPFFPETGLKTSRCVIHSLYQEEGRNSFFFPKKIKVQKNFFNYFLIGESLLYNVVVSSAIQQCESAISIHMSPPSWTCLSSP